ncbi:transglutaminase family protein [Algiphilus sp. W345]|uniref:Transglutaminase family protein n=1 Tax=Banduia mediterranea TaxID=3075609 RepID=A0ABU2WEB6_9GAMM|nr:transglutaminase family protein [Algiphilus sp. W345]MDT0496200.1 transglutaminase family protein [Algiphilus sp. W345]
MSPDDDLKRFLVPSPHVNSDHPGIRAFAARVTDGLAGPRERAVALYQAVRDGFRYDPYAIEMSGRCLMASRVFESGAGFCIGKATLLSAACRAVGIPARQRFADVRNHLTSPRLREMMGTDQFVYHGYNEVWIDGRWRKCTPAFNKSLCDKAGIRVLDFDGIEDSVFHPIDLSGRQHMEYLHDRGSHVDVPVNDIFATWQQVYPGMADWTIAGTSGDFEQEARAPADADTRRAAT